MSPVADAETGDVVTWKIADDVPGATVTVGGADTAATAGLLEVLNTGPTLLEAEIVTGRLAAGGALPSKWTVAATVWPPVTTVELRTTDCTDAGRTISDAVAVSPETDADTVTVATVVTPTVPMRKAATACPAGTTTFTLAAAGGAPGTLFCNGATSIDDVVIVTVVPPVGAAELRVTDPATRFPPTTGAGLI